MGPITQARLKELLSYDPDTGEFTRLVATGRCGCHRAGVTVGNTSAAGYRQTTVDGVRIYLHRLAFLYMTGELPTQDVDHIDGRRSNNKWSNLRQVPRAVNLQNRRSSRKDRKYGTLLGVKKHRNKWQARINGINLGGYATELEAHHAYVTAKRILHEGCTL